MYKKYLKWRGYDFSEILLKYVVMMKLTLIFLTVFFVQVSATGLAQEVTIRVHNMPIQDVFHRLTLKTGYNFIAEAGTLTGLEKVTLDVTNTPLKSVLERFLDPKKIEILFGNNETVIIKPRQVGKAGDTKSTVNVARPQERDVRGTVRDSAGVPLAGVTVKAAGAPNVGTYTDANGRYVLAVSNEITSIEFSMVGYTTVVAELGGKEVIDAVLIVSDSQIDEVVVVGFGTQKKMSVTGAISTVKPTELQRIATPMLSNSLGGVLSGMITRQASGEPGYDNAALFIRGIATMGTSSRAPLILVDGVERDINVLNTAEIESFTILKDASATAVYGVRGANGVILIETKRGQRGRPKVTLRTEMANLRGLRFPKYINGYEFASLMNEASINSGLEEESWPWTSEDLAKFRDGTDPYLYPDVDWTDEVLKRDAFQTINNLSVSGGNDVARYFVNVGYTSQTGLFKEDPQYEYRTNSKSDRYNFRSNVDINLSKDFIIDLGLAGIIQDRTYPGTPAQPIFDAMKRISPINYAVRNPDGTPGGGVSYLMDNPWALATQSGYAKQFRNTLQGTFGSKWDMSSYVQGLTVSAKFSFDYYYFNEVFRRKPYEVKQYLGTDADGNDQYNVVRREGAMGYQIVQNSDRAYYYETSMNYQRMFGNHNITGMMLFNRRDFKNLTAGSSIINLPNRRQGWAGRLTYDYSGRYLAEFNFGYNGSENFPKGQRYGFFPSGSIGWVISNEGFWKTTVVNHLKFRGSYGVVGNDLIGGDRFLYLSTVDKNANGYHFGQGMAWMNGYAEAKMGAANITWEKSYKANVGLDLELFRGMIVLQGDYFQENRRDILLQRGTVPNITGITSASIPWANVGKVDNHGLDFNLEVRKHTPSGFYYLLRTNATFAQNKIINDDKAIQRWENLNTIGHPVDQPFGLVALGLFQDDDDVRNSVPQNLGTAVKPGDIKYKDVNDDGVVNEDDYTAIGYPRTPEIMFGIGGTIAYKGFEISLQFTGAARTSTFLDSEGMWPYSLEYPNYNVLREYYDNRWIPGAPDNSGARYPAVIRGRNTNNYRPNTLYLRNAEYIKLKNAEVAYNFPKDFLAPRKIGDLRVFVNGNNLLCFDYLKIIDPESNYGTGGYPQQRTLNFGIQLTY